MKIDYIKAVKGQEPALQSLLEELGYSVDRDTLVNRIDIIRQLGGEIFIANVDGKVAGCVNAIIDVRLAAGEYGEIVSLVVSDKYRGLGIGKGLCHTAETWLNIHCKKIRVRANSKRLEAHGFYESLGFKEIKTQKIFVK